MEPYRDDPDVQIYDRGRKRHKDSTVRKVEFESGTPPRQRPNRHRSYRRIALAVLAVGALCLGTTCAIVRPRAARTLLYALEDRLSDFTSFVSSSASSSSSSLSYVDTDDNNDRKAFLTFLGAHQTNDPYAEDMYYIATRILAYQLMHAPNTASQYPLVIAVTKDVDPMKRAQLEDDGAEVVEIPEVIANHIPYDTRYRDMLTKLNIFSLYDGGYDRFCYMDADTLLLANMDGVFDDPAARVQRTKRYAEEVKDDEAAMPATYLFAGHSEHDGHHGDGVVVEHQDPTSQDYMNGGFVVFAPTPEIHAYYLDLVNVTDGRWNHMWNEQNLWNYAHRKGGNMPWTRVGGMWNKIGPTEEDVSNGVRSLHAHLWVDGMFGYPGRRHEIWVEKRREMEAFYAGNLLVLEV